MKILYVFIGGAISHLEVQGINTFGLTSCKNIGVVVKFLFSSDSRTSRLVVILKQAAREPCDKDSLKYAGRLKG